MSKLPPVSLGKGFIILITSIVWILVGISFYSFQYKNPIDTIGLVYQIITDNHTKSDIDARQKVSTVTYSGKTIGYEYQGNRWIDVYGMEFIPHRWLLLAEGKNDLLKIPHTETGSVQFAIPEMSYSSGYISWSLRDVFSNESYPRSLGKELLFPIWLKVYRTEFSGYQDSVSDTIGKVCVDRKFLLSYMYDHYSDRKIGTLTNDELLAFRNEALEQAKKAETTNFQYSFSLYGLSFPAHVALYLKHIKDFEYTIPSNVNAWQVIADSLSFPACD